MDKRKILVLSLLVLFVVGMSLSAVSASKNVKIGKYKVKLTNSDIKKIKNGKQVTKSTGKYIKYQASANKIVKAKVKISVSKKSNDGGTKKGKYYAESWSSAGPIKFRWVKL
ncbi:hypothetical protein [Methanobrevibacter sp.]|uniref:hypothetical protein n=1 Tax=Methanobrevibacter sp. TaxID=66852 RepID=UPI00386F0FC9